MTKYFTSDTHYDHGNIMRYCHRPFETVEEMNTTMISNWNSVVKPGDEVYHVGDFAFVKNKNRINEILRQLNGQVHLILGNHDKQPAKQANFASVSSMKKIKIGDTKIILCHYAMRVWDQSHYGTYHLYGHSHGTLADDPNALSCDIGVDCWNFTPVSIEQIREVMHKKNFKPIDHHRV